MTDLTIEQLQRVMPRLKRATSEAEKYIAPLNAAMTEFQITTPHRQAVFLAQIAHESGQLVWWEEIWGPTKAQKRYEPPSDLAKRLGNTEPGDGVRYKGRGPIQLTGRANYRQIGQILDVDLESNPELAATPEVGFRIAGAFWDENMLNEIADETADPHGATDAFVRATKRVNGGLNGLSDRLKYWERATKALGIGA